MLCDIDQRFNFKILTIKFYHLEYSKFPNYEEICKKIIEFKKKELVKFDSTLHKNINEYCKLIESELYNYFPFLPYTCTIMNSKEINLDFYRVRELEQFNNTNLITEHSFPPIPFTKIGRCNFPKNPVFYCSNNPITSLCEVTRNTEYENKNYCISVWKIKKNISVDTNIHNFLYSDLPEENFFKKLKDIEIQKIDKIFGDNLSQSQKNGLNELMKFIHTEFINDIDYSISSTLSHTRIYANHQYSADILIYPSNQSNRVGINFAIHPNYVNNMMEIKRLYIIKALKLINDQNNFEIKFKSYADLNNNRFIWKEMPDDLNEIRKIIQSDFKNGKFE